MIKGIILIALTGMCFSLSAQNVGIGTNTPSERLDVHGNINVTGSIKVNGTDGSANQVLKKSGTGELTWSSLSEFNNFKMFEFTFVGATQQFTVPAGVTRIAIELWGGGGGGSQAGGGGAGGYAIAFADVSAGMLATIAVGAGGAGSTETGNASNGGESSILINGTTLSVYGGFGAFSSFPGAGGGIAQYSSNYMFQYFKGGTGKKNTESYQQASATDFYLVTKYGNGGVAYNMPQTGGEGGYTITSTSTGFTIKEVFGSQGMGVGEGGGGGKSYGYQGGFGRVVVHW